MAKRIILQNEDVTQSAKRIILQNEDGTSEIFVPEPKPIPDPDPPPPTPQPRSNYGWNVAYNDYWSTERPFIDLTMQCSKWQPTVTTWGTAAMPPLDSNGYPLQIPTGGYMGSIIDLSPGDGSEYAFYSNPAGRMFLDGQLSVNSWRKASANQRVIIRVKQPISSWEFRAREHENSTELFRTPFRNRCSLAGAIRFMNWNRVNQVNVSYEFAKRTTMGYYTQAETGQPVALDVQAQLCKVSGVPMWHCFHHLHADEYIRQACELFVRILGPDHPMIFEHSNEVWNWSFAQAHYAAARSPITGSPWEYHLKRTGEIAAIVKSIIPKAHVTFGAQAVAWGQFDYLLSKGLQFPGNVDSIAIAPYFGNPLTEAAKLSVDLMLNECDASIDAYGEHCTMWMARADKLGKRLLGYEGGQHVSPKETEKSNTALVDRMIAVNRHPRMYDLYRDYLRMWDATTRGSLMCLFESVSSYSKHGCWGHQEYEGQPLAGAHKLRAVYDHIGVPEIVRPTL